MEKWLGRDPLADHKRWPCWPTTPSGPKYAYTGWQVLERYGNFTYIACKLKTGRTHQIRVHMASTGHPLAGDAVYGPKNCIKSLNGQCLHAKELGFVHPRTGEWMQFDSPLPPYFADFYNTAKKGTSRMKPPLGDTLVICDMDNTLLTAKGRHPGLQPCGYPAVHRHGGCSRSPRPPAGVHPRGAGESEAVAAGYLLQRCAAV